MASADRVRRSIEFQFGVDLGPAENSIAGLEEKLKKLKDEFEAEEIGSARFKELGQEIQSVQSKLKTLDTQIEGLTAEQKAAAIVDSFNAVTGAISVVSGAMVTLGIKSDVLEDVEKRLLGLISITTGLQAVSKGIESLGKIAPGAAAAITKLGTALRNLIVTNPILSLVAAVAALTAGLYALSKANKEVNNELETEKKRREELLKLYAAQEDFDNKLYDNAVQRAELEGDITAAQENRIAAAERAYQTAKNASTQTLKTLNEELTQVEANIVGYRKLQSEGLANAELRTLTEQGLNKALLRRIEIANEIGSVEQDVEKKRLAIEAERQKIEKENEDRNKAAFKAASERRQKEIQELVALGLSYDQFIIRLRKIRGITQTEIVEATKDAAESWNAAARELDAWIERQKQYIEDTPLAIQTGLRAIRLTAEELETLNDLWDEANDNLETYNFFSKEQLDIIKRLREGNKTQLQEQLDALQTQYETELALFADNEEYKSQLTEEYEQNRAKLRRQYALQTSREILGITSQFLGTIAEINQASLELQLAQAQGNQEAITRINEAALEKQKKLRTAQALVTTAESILNGFNSTSTLPVPFNWIAGGVLAAAYTALGAKTIQTINSVTLGGGNVGGGYNNIPRAQGGISLPGGAGVSTGIPAGILPGIGGGRLGSAPTVGTIAEGPIRAYVLAGDVTNGVQANVALNNRRRLAG